MAESSKPSVCVVLPCLNEVESVGACVAEAHEALSASGYRAEVIVVDNGSRDGSGRVAASAGARVIEEPAPGYGSALRAGIAAARSDIVVMADADLTYDLSKISMLVDPLVCGDCDLVIGSRLDTPTRQTMPLLHRYIGTPILSYLISRSCGQRVARDSQSGFRAFSRRKVHDLDLQSTGMEFASEMLIRAARAGLRICEVETGYRARVGTSKLSTFSDGWRHVQLILVLAPDLLLVRPGATLAGFGAVTTGLGLLGRSGVDIGSLRWQPVFFAGIALVLGLQGLLAGAVLAYRSSVTIGNRLPRFSFVGEPAFPRRCLAAGAAMIAAGLMLDGALFVAWLRGSPSPPVHPEGIASLAQSLLVTGGTLASFGLTAPSFIPKTATASSPAGRA